LNGALFIFSFFRKDKKAGVEGGIVDKKKKINTVEDIFSFLAMI
jgi:hypothetical protein